MTNPEKTETFYVNPAYEEVWGRSVEDAYDDPKSFLEAIHPEDRGRVERALADQVTGDYEEVYRIRRPDGEVRWIHDRAVPIENDAGEVYRVVGIAADISERQQHKEQLQFERDRFATLFENLPNPVVHCKMTDGHPVIRRVNRAFEEVFGHDTKSVAGENLDDIVVPEGRHPEAAMTNKQVIDQGRVQTEGKRRTAHGLRDFVIDVVVRDRSTPAPEAYAIYTDITERKERERLIERQNDRLEEFAAVVSHDLRNPLEVANAGVELARQDCESDHLTTVANAHDRMDALIGDLLTLAQEGETVRDLHPVYLPAIVEKSWQTVTNTQATLEVNTNLTISADPDRLQQLLENLFHNAIDHGGQTVTITVGDLDDAAGFYVADDGPGIPADDRDRVFDSGYSTAQTGTGLGLSIVQRIAEAHDWEIRATRSADGGARFEITGPRATAATADASSNPQ